jgi:hypothetical protein
MWGVLGFGITGGLEMKALIAEKGRAVPAGQACSGSFDYGWRKVRASLRSG